MRYILIILFISLFSILSSKLAIDIQSLRKDENSFKIKYNINVYVYLLGIVKIKLMNITSYNIRSSFLNKKYKKIRISFDDIEKIDKVLFCKALKKINLRIKNMYFNLEIGLEDIPALITLIFAISQFFTIILKKFEKYINNKVCNYKIIPVYNTSKLSFDSSFQVEIKLWNLACAFIFLYLNKKNICIKKEFLQII